MSGEGVSRKRLRDEHTVSVGLPSKRLKSIDSKVGKAIKHASQGLEANARLGKAGGLKIKNPSSKTFGKNLNPSVTKKCLADAGKLLGVLRT